jgi:mono/diheme cytochrome c family protein
MYRLSSLLQSCALTVLAVGIFPAANGAASGDVTFERDVRPILKAHCFQCHGEEGEVKGDLDVRLKRLLEKGGETGPAIVAGKPHESLLIELVKEGEMPKKAKPLKPEEIATLEQWIAQGAKTLRPEPEKVEEASGITEEERHWWAFQPISRPVPPGVADNPIDAFVQEKLRGKKLTASPEADRATLVRRAYFDLIGLPPTRVQVDAFVNDARPDAWAKLIDELLASPRYGERWGRHWLDVVGYADSEGYNDDDTPRESAWRYRDYVIQAFNADKPFDRFIQEQLAGDEMIAYPRTGDLSPDDIEKLTATGFLRMAPDGTGTKNMDQKVAQNAVITETVKIVSSSLLGMTVGCAECHDHRFDPILQRDFYRLRAVLEPGLNFAGWLEPKKREISLKTKAEDEQIAGVDQQIKALDADYQAKLDGFQAWTLDKELEAIPEAEREFARTAALAWREGRKKKGEGKEGLTPEQTKYLFDNPFLKISATEQQLNLFVERHAEKRDEFQQAVKDYKAEKEKLSAKKPVIGTLRALTEMPARPIPVTALFQRGNHLTPGEKVGPGDLSVLSHVLPVDIVSDDPTLATSGRRLAYAKHLTNGKHPLLARVLVNRFWMHHFGRGLVGTAGDFGRQGEKPTHPELLDWLASEFMDKGWSLKELHRAMMTSATYRQSSVRRVEADKVDAANALYWRANVRRLEAETIRDTTLAVTGSLNLKPFGAPVSVMEDANAQVVVGGKEPSKDGQEFRRSVYVQQRRSALPYQLAVFDSPQMEPNCEARNLSTVAPQSLLLMNSAFVVEQSRAFARRVSQDTGANAGSAALVRRAWELAFSVPAAPADEADGAHYLDEQTASFTGEDAREKALASLCQALLGTNQFLYVD